MGWVSTVINKLNPSQHLIGGGPSAEEGSKEPTMTYQQGYEKLEVVNRGVNMIVDDAAQIPLWVGDPVKGATPQFKGMRKAKLDLLLNFEPNPFQDINSFRRNLFIDYLIDGNIFIYFDGAHMYHLPACKMKIVTDSITYISKYTYNREVDYKPSEIIHIKENSFDSIYRGTSRLRPALETLQLLMAMNAFQKNFFKNGAVPGLVIKTPDTLSQKVKDRLIASWKSKYNPLSGGRSPLILDGGMSVETITTTSFKELDFENSIVSKEYKVLKALGVPPILLDSGNNANLKPNVRLFYLETVIPIVKKLNAGFERQFGYRVEEDVTRLPAMQQEMSEQAGYFSTLVNGGIISPAEARKDLGLPEIAGHDDLRIPANIAGSAVNPSTGGRPNENE